MNTGKKLEALIKQSAEELGWDCTRLRDAGWQGEKTQRRFTVKNICDFILFKTPDLFFIEAKSGKTSITFDRLTQQEDLLKKNNPEKRIYAGYICEIKGKWFFLAATAIHFMEINLGKKSFNADDADAYGYELVGYIPNGKRKARINLDYLAHLTK